jgi:hypothetical protein
MVYSPPGTDDMLRVMLPRPRAFVLAAASALLFSYCYSGECRQTCSQATARLEIDDGTVTIVEADGSESTVPIVPGNQDEVEGDACRMDGVDVEVQGNNDVYSVLSLSCDVFGEGMPSFSFGGVIVDPRTLDSDTTEEVTIWLDCTGDQTVNLGGSVADISVTEAVGGIAPLPEMVTADFRRSYSVELDTGAIYCSRASVPAGCPFCKTMESVQVSFSIEQTAASYTYTESVPCECE